MPSLDKAFVGRLRSKGWKQEYDAAAELYTRSLFYSLDGLHFEFQSELQGKTPDFLLHNLHGESVLADVTVLHGGPIEEADKQQDDYRHLRRKIMDIESDLFAPLVFSMQGSRSVKGPGGDQVAFDKIVHPVRKWILETEKAYRKSPNIPVWKARMLCDSLVKSGCVSQNFRFEELGIDLQFPVELYWKSEETEEHRRLRRHLYEGNIGIAFTYMDDTDIRLEKSLEKKIRYLGMFKNPQSENGSLPYMVIIFGSNSFTPDREDIEKVLYGSSMGYHLGAGPLHDDLHQWELRTAQSLTSYSDGIFTNRRKDFLAVLVCQGHVASPASCEVSMWLNPYASHFRIPQSLFRLKTYTLNRQIVCTLPA